MGEKVSKQGKVSLGESLTVRGGADDARKRANEWPVEITWSQ